MKVTKKQALAFIEEIAVSLHEPAIPEPVFYFKIKQLEEFTAKGYFEKGELTTKGHENIEELLPYIHYK